MKIEVTHASIVNDMGVVASVELVDGVTVKVNINQYVGWNDWIEVYEAIKKIRVNEHMFDDIEYSWTEMPYTAISSNLKPSGELPLHFGLQRQMGQHTGEVRVVAHLHPTYCVAAMHRGIELSELVRDFPELARYTRVASNVGDVPPISQELADRCHENLELDAEGRIAYDIVGIKGHGVVAIDTSPWRAFEHIERLEHICKIVLASGIQ